MRLLVLIFSLFFSSQLLAQVAKITALNGKATIERESQSIAAKVGSVILEKDTIKTSETSRLQMIFKDKTVITLGKSTVFSVQEFLFDETAESTANFSLTKGFLKSVTGKIGKVAPQRFKIKTKTSTIGIRGTTFTLEANEQFTRLTTIDGATYFIDDISGSNYQVEKNQQLTYSPTTQEVEVKEVELSSPEIISVTPAELSDGESTINNEEQRLREAITNNTISNDTEQKVISGTGTYARYGYWERAIDKQPVRAFAEAVPGQTTTPTSVINELIVNSIQNTYSGNVIAFDQPKNKGVGTISMTVSFNGTPAISGVLDFTVNGVRWHNDFEGSIDSTNAGLQVNSFSPRAGTNVNNPVGTMSGKFYGPLAQETAGTFNMRGENAGSGVAVDANGSFVAAKP